MRNTMEVGEMETDKSAYGVYDMVGNAQEWTSEELAAYPDSPARRDEAFRSNYIAVRGGSYNVKGRTMGLYSRSGYAADSQYGISFRLCAGCGLGKSLAEIMHKPGGTPGSANP